LFRKGLVAHALHRLDEAVAAYRAALSEETDQHFASLDPAVSGYKARHNLALVYADMGRHALAELEWRRILLELPDYRPAWLGLGESLIRQAKHKSLESGGCVSKHPRGDWRNDAARNHMHLFLRNAAFEIDFLQIL
jgi:tetratricopeptide (TPR) repeat protein